MPRALVVTAVAIVFVAPKVVVEGQYLATRTNIPYSDAAPVLRALRGDLLPPALRGRTAEDVEAGWPVWVSSRDEAIRARVAAGEADSLIYLLQFGTSFTKQPRIGERELAGVLVRQSGAEATTFVPSPVLLARIEDFVAAVASPGANTRLRFARDVVAGRGIDVDTASGRDELRRYLRDRVEVVGQAERLSRLNPDADVVDRATMFRDRGLAPDTSVFVNFGIDETLVALKAAGLLHEGEVRRVGIVGAGLDFTDKQEGYDFYPEQTIQPFAVVDSLMRLGLSAARDLQVTAFDVSARVLQHLHSARRQAQARSAYTVMLPRPIDRSWTPDLVRYWQRFGDRIGDATAAPRPPAAAGRLEVRAVAVRPPVVLSVMPRDLNIVLQRLESLPPDDRFDLIVLTNVLIYYDVFEQSMAMANAARMLRPGGILLSNDPIFELPDSTLTSIGHTSAVYFRTPAGERGDRVGWYQRKSEGGP